MVLLKPVFEVAKANSKYMSIVLFQHDGFTVSYRDNLLVKTMEDKMRRAVRAQASTLGILTDLDGGLVD